VDELQRSIREPRGRLQQQRFATGVELIGWFAIGAEEIVALRESFDRPDQFKSGIGLEHVAAGSRIADSLDERAGVVHSENQNSGVEILMSNLAGCLDAIHLGHGDIEDRDIGGELFDPLYCLDAVGCFVDHLPFRPGLQD